MALPNVHCDGWLRPAGPGEGSKCRVEGMRRAAGGSSALPSRRPAADASVREARRGPRDTSVRKARRGPVTCVSGRRGGGHVTRPSGRRGGGRRPHSGRARRSHQLGLQRLDPALVGGLLRGQLPPGHLLRHPDAPQRLLPGSELRLPHLGFQPAEQSGLDPGNPAPRRPAPRGRLTLGPRLWRPPRKLSSLRWLWSDFHKEM